MEAPSKYWLFSKFRKTMQPINDNELYLYKYNNYYQIYEDTRFLAKVRLYNYYLKTLKK